MKVRLKICGMKVPANISEAVDLKPDYLGFIFYPGSKRFVKDLDAAEIRNIPASIKTTGVFVNQDLAEVKQAVTAYRLKAVQLHGDESPEYCRSIRGDVEVIKAFGVDASFDFSQLDAYSAVVDYFLFDTKTAQHGGSGKTFSWALLQNYTLSQPYFLSGGIGPESISELQQIDDNRLYAIDVNSRFETAPGLKDIEQLKKFKNLLCC